MKKGTVYTETVVWSAPEALVSEAPYQIAIVTLEDGKRVTGRVRGERVAIGDAVEMSGEVDEVPQIVKG
ncbi:MAG: OB-fold domain-containing protein [Bryobacteraceae bacterium]